MPKLKESNKKLKAKHLSKLVIENNLNQSATARKLGVSRQTIQEKVNQPLVQIAIAEYLNSQELKDKLIKVANEGLEANRLHSANIIIKKDPKTGKLKVVQNENDFVEIEYHPARWKYWHDLGITIGFLKNKIEQSGEVTHNHFFSEIDKKAKDIDANGKEKKRNNRKD